MAEPRDLKDDWTWARERVVDLCANALIDASRLGTKILKGFGYPNEIFRAAQDYRALSMVLERLQSLEAERDRFREALMLAQKDIRDWTQTARGLRNLVDDPDHSPTTPSRRGIDESERVLSQIEAALTSTPASPSTET